MRFAGKTVVLCVTGGIAAYKAADLTSKLHQNGATVVCGAAAAGIRAAGRA